MRIAVDRVSTPRPAGAPRTFVCPACDFVLWDEVDYMRCPKCDLPVDWVDLDRPLWCCATCDAFVNETRAEWPHCARCNSLMDRVHSLEQAPESNVIRPPGWLFVVGGSLWTAASLAQLVITALDPLGFAFVAPLALLVVIGAVALVVAAIASLGELRAIARDRATRVVHGLEHASINLLRASGVRALSGQTEPGGFVIDLADDGSANKEVVDRAVNDAIARVRAGEQALAYSRHCGTSLLVALSLLGLIVVAGSMTGIVLGVQRDIVIAAVATSALLGWLAARPLGLLAQRYLTVATRFSSAHVTRILQCATDGARLRYLVTVDVTIC